MSPASRSRSTNSKPSSGTDRYRIIYDVDDTTRTVTVALVGHRREVYRGLALSACAP